MPYAPIELLYNLLPAERLHFDHGGDDEPVDRYRAQLSEWATREANEEDYDPAPFDSIQTAKRLLTYGYQQRLCAVSEAHRECGMKCGNCKYTIQ